MPEENSQNHITRTSTTKLTAGALLPTPSDKKQLSRKPSRPISPIPTVPTAALLPQLQTLDSSARSSPSTRTKSRSARSSSAPATPARVAGADACTAPPSSPPVPGMTSHANNKARQRDRLRLLGFLSQNGYGKHRFYYVYSQAEGAA